MRLKTRVIPRGTELTKISLNFERSKEGSKSISESVFLARKRLAAEVKMFPRRKERIIKRREKFLEVKKMTRERLKRDPSNWARVAWS